MHFPLLSIALCVAALQPVVVGAADARAASPAAQQITRAGS
jgi:hypothetical protein